MNNIENVGSFFTGIMPTLATLGVFVSMFVKYNTSQSVMRADVEIIKKDLGELKKMLSSGDKRISDIEKEQITQNHRIENLEKEVK